MVHIHIDIRWCIWVSDETTKISAWPLLYFGYITKPYTNIVILPFFQLAINSYCYHKQINYLKYELWRWTENSTISMPVNTFDPVIKIPKRALVPSPPSGSNRRGQTSLNVVLHDCPHLQVKQRLMT